MLADARGVSAALYAIAVLCVLALIAGCLLPNDARAPALAARVKEQNSLQLGPEASSPAG